MTAILSSEVIILGGGLVGMTLAIGLAREGIASVVVDASDPAVQTAEGFDGRASAISTASWNLYTNLGMADALEARGCPIAAIAVSDGLKPGRIDFRPEADEGSLGRMFANRDLRLVMYEIAAKHDLITFLPNAQVTGRERGAHGVHVTLADGRALAGRLLVAAEGRRSPTRDHRRAGARTAARQCRLGNILSGRAFRAAAAARRCASAPSQRAGVDRGGKGRGRGHGPARSNLRG
jgi:2-octaprenyl-6-methoxyphenol hydroxylase